VPEDIVPSVATEEVPSQSDSATPTDTTGQVPSRTYTDAELQEHVRRATSTTQRDLARVQAEHQRALQQLNAMQSGQQVPPEQMIFQQGRNAALQEYQMRSQIAEVARKAGLEVEPYSPEVDEMLGRNPVEGYTKLATKLADAVDKRKRELEKEYKTKTESAQVDAHNKWSTSSSAKVPSVSGASSDTNYADMDSAKFAEVKKQMLNEARNKRRS